MNPGFYTPLEVEPADEHDDGLWRLQRNFNYYSGVLSRAIIVPAGFVTDFASVPRIPIAYELCGAKANEASVVHDYLYSNGKLCTRAQADAVFKEAMLLSGVPKWRANIMWAGVRLFGGSHFGRP
jgi:hypothetical protein